MPRILIVEDEIGAIAALKRVLVRAGFEVSLATNTADALSAAEHGAPDAVVLSAELQGDDSASLHDTLTREKPGLPLLVLGGAELGPEELRLSRPVDGAQLLERLRAGLDTSPPAAVAEAKPAAAAAVFGVPAAGDLADIEPARLLAACCRGRWTGELRFQQGAVRRSLYWHEGRLQGAASSSPDEQLETIALRRGLLTREQQRQVRAERPLGTRRAALLMVERAYLKSVELFPLVQARVEEIACSACGGFEGRYELHDGRAPPEERVALTRSPLAVMTEGIRRKYLLERLLEALGGPATLLRPAGDGAPDLADFELTARERRLAASLDGMRNVEELLFEHGSEPLAGLQLFHALVLGGFAEIAVRGLAGELSPEVSAAIDLGRVAEKYEQVRTASYFDVLGLALDATGYEVRQAYDRLAREFHPERYERLKDRSVREQLDEIQRVLAEARDVLGDDRLRAEYGRHRRRA